MVTNNSINTSKPIQVARGGTGIASTTPYAVIAGGTTGTGPLQNAGTGTDGQILVSNGSAALPSWQSLSFGPGEQNLAFGYDSGTGVFSITAQDGSALSPTNAGHVTLNSKSFPTRLITIAVTANQTFVDATGASTISGNTFGLPPGVAYAEDIPFFVYAVLNDAEDALSFMISRVPHATTAPTESNIGKTGVPNANTQGSFFALDDPTRADYEENPCLNIGAFRMQMNSSNDWTVQTFSNGAGFNTVDYRGADGIGQFHEESIFHIPLGGFGSAAGSHFRNNGGTAPIFNNSSVSYYLARSGRVFLVMGALNCTVGGTGGVDTLLSLPFYGTDGPTTSGTGYFLNAGGAITLMITGIDENDIANFYTGNVAGFSRLGNAAITAGANVRVQAQTYYQIKYA